jgi:hypothetical protein
MMGCTSVSTKSAHESCSIAMAMLMLNKNHEPKSPISTIQQTFPLNKRPRSLAEDEVSPTTIAKTDTDHSYSDVGVSKKPRVLMLNGGFRMPSLQGGKANQAKPVSLAAFQSIWSKAESQGVSRELFARRLYRGGTRQRAIKPTHAARNDFRLPSLGGNTDGDKKKNKPAVVKRTSSSLKSFRQVWSMAEDKEVAREILSRKMQKGPR